MSEERRVQVDEIEPGMWLHLDGRWLTVVTAEAGDLETTDEDGATVYVGLNPHPDGYPVATTPNGEQPA
ncbi:hypothetical protein ABN028_19620 [Actinopolymorpha sp. B17G11]|uniref:hypothetical protein n=1 Tax=Actinopolymorpha sp. B17G11 TaxID=3160861 RepID=UPI0032E46CDA